MMWSSHNDSSGSRVNTEIDSSRIYSFSKLKKMTRVKPPKVTTRLKSLQPWSVCRFFGNCRSGGSGWILACSPTIWKTALEKIVQGRHWVGSERRSSFCCIRERYQKSREIHQKSSIQSQVWITRILYDYHSSINYILKWSRFSLHISPSGPGVDNYLSKGTKVEHCDGSAKSWNYVLLLNAISKSKTVNVIVCTGCSWDVLINTLLSYILISGTDKVAVYLKKRQLNKITIKTTL